MKKTKGEILLESGTNEIEIMEFMIYGELYGINVAKVTEIMMSDKVKPIPHSHPVVEGIFKPRETVLTVIDLPKYLTGRESEKDEKDLFIVTNFNKMFATFRVHSVVGISRISWNDIQKPDKTISGGDEGVATGIAQTDGVLVTILDFEKIVSEIAPETGIQIEEIEKMGLRSKSKKPIVMAEDSVLLNRLIVDSLKQAGYVNLTHTCNGQEAFDIIYECKKDGTLKDKVRCVITDIEMPIMDGHRLTRLIKEDDDTKDIPVIIFSSLVNDEMRKKGEALGADAQLSKPEIRNLVTVIDRLIGNEN